METIKRLPARGSYLLLAYMPFHIFLSQSLSLLTGGLDAWKLGKDVLTVLLSVVTVVLVYALRKQNKVFNVLVGLFSLYVMSYAIVWAINPDIYTKTALLGTLYNLRVIAYAVLGFGAALLAPHEISNTKIIKLVLIVAGIVSVLGILQYFLPKDILGHFGYSIERGVKPNFFIDDKADLPRIMSTLRDPNSLAAYLILPLCISIGLFFNNKKRRMLFGGLTLLMSLALFLTFSRGGLLGAIIAIAAIIGLRFRGWLLEYAKPLTIGFFAAVVVFGTLGYVHRDQYVVQNIILHSDESTKATEDSNELHARLAADGAKAIVKRPQGHGPGTAGIVSIQNPKGGVLTENYFVQIGYEVGIIGLALFLIIWGYILFRLSKNSSLLSSSLLASAAAYAVLCLIMHLWTNEAIAATWWITAGLVLGQKPLSNHKS
ncbi:MAG: O-antigen ligase family protein [Candidatus Saccharibacteria bacterium]|nr:O-antigen ligase family protein [Candidatus Saccharibacteria bacterium]